MLRLSLRRLAFRDGVLSEFDSRHAVSFRPLTSALVGELKRLPGGSGAAGALLLRSEPQSGKTSFCQYLEQHKQQLFAPEGWNFNFLRADEAGAWLDTARRLNKKDTVLVLDEAHLRFGDQSFGDFFKNSYSGRAVFVGTSTGNTTLTPSTPFRMRQFYMQPDFAPAQELQTFAESNLREALAQHGGHLDPGLWAKMAESLVHICGMRVGIVNSIGFHLSQSLEVRRLLETGQEPLGQAPLGQAPLGQAPRSLWSEVAPKFHALIFKALQDTRLLAGSNGGWNPEQAHLVAASILEGGLRRNVFDADSFAHRNLFSTAGLRVASDGADGPLTLIKQATPCTPVAPYCYQELLETRVPRYFAVAEAAALMPCRLEPPEDGLDLVLRCLPHMKWRAVLCGEQIGSKPLRTAFTVADALPREVGGFQAAFREAVARLFGADKQPTTKDNQLDLPYVINGNPCNVEMLLRTASLQEHHSRFEGKYAEYTEGGVIVCFVGKSNDLNHLERQQMPLVVPVLLAHFQHGAFDLQCRLHRPDQPAVEFALQLDGVAKKLTRDGSVETAQRIVADDESLQRWMVRKLPANYEKTVGVWWQGADGRVRMARVPGDQLHVEGLRQALPERFQDLEVHLPNQYGAHVKALRPDTRLPLTSHDCPLLLRAGIGR